MSRVYWFTEDPKKVASVLSEHHNKWVSFGSNPFAQAWLRNSIAYYSTILEPNDWQSALGFTGDQGELIRMSVPQARSLIRQIVTLITKQRLAFSPVSESSETEAIQDARISKALIDQIIRDQKLDALQDVVLEQSLVYGISFLKAAWRTDKGKPYAVDEIKLGETIVPTIAFDGDIEITAPSVYDVYFNARIDNWNELPWAESRSLKNRWDLIAQFPEMEVAILALPSAMTNDRVYDQQAAAADQDDLIYVYEAYHRPCPSLPEGRMLMYSDENTVYYDGPNKYECIPIIPIKPEQVFKSAYGYPQLSNLLPAQEMYDHSLSAIASNQSQLAVQNVLCPRGADVSVQDIGGLNWIYFTPQSTEGGGKPEPMQLLQSAPETFKFADIMKGYMLEISGINTAVRGEPPPGVTSGTAIATLTANALEFLSAPAKSLDLGLEQLMELVFKIYSVFPETEREVMVTGKDNRAYSYKWDKSSIQRVKKIKIVRSNPLMSTLAGRSDVAEKLLQTGMIKSPQQYFRILEGAPTEELYAQELSETDLMAAENEALRRGEPVRALITDDHAEHIRHHTILTNDLKLRMNDPIIANITAHIEEHYALAQSQDPMLTAMVRTGKMPQGQAPMAGGMPPPDAAGMQEPAEPQQAEVAPEAEDLLGRI